MRAGDLGCAGGTGYEFVKSLAAVTANVFVNGHKLPKDNKPNQISPTITKYIIAPYGR